VGQDFFIKTVSTEQPVEAVPIPIAQAQRQQILRHRMPPKTHQLGQCQPHRPLVRSLLMECRPVYRHQPEQFL
jgi:hypothetical protein